MSLSPIKKNGRPLRAGGRPARDVDCCYCQLSCACLGTIVYEFINESPPENPLEWISQPLGVGVLACCVVFRARFWFETYDGISGQNGWVYIFECCCVNCDCYPGTYNSDTGDGNEYEVGGGIWCGGLDYNYPWIKQQKLNVTCLTPETPEVCYAIIRDEEFFNETPDCSKPELMCAAMDNGEELIWAPVYRHCDYTGEGCPTDPPTSGTDFLKRSYNI